MAHALTAVVLFLVCAFVYLANGRTIGAGDTLPARYLPFSILREWNFDLDEFPFLFDQAARQATPLLDGIPYFLRNSAGHYLSAYSPGAAMLAVPIFAGPVLAGLSPNSPWVPWLEKLTASLVVALSVVVLYLALARLVTRGPALLVALVYAFGTSSLSISSQGLWQHGPSQLCLALLVYCLVRGLREERYWAYAGLAASAAVVMRPMNVVVVGPVAVYLLWTRRRLAPWFLLWALPPALVLVAYHLAHFGISNGGLGSRHTSTPLWAFFAQTPLGTGAAGTLLSPGRGLFVYSPVLVFALAGIVMVWRRGPAVLAALSLGVPALVLTASKWFMWWGGYTYGPRLLADGAPLLCFFLYPVARTLGRRPLVRAAFVSLALWSFAAHALGAFRYDLRWDALAETDRHPERLWRWKDGPIAFYAKEVLADLRPPAPHASPLPSAGLSASYLATALPTDVVAGDRLDVSVVATNTGPATWLPTTPDERGAVRLGWRWHDNGRVHEEGRTLLGAAVPPGESTRLRARITAPARPGRYTLAVDLVSEHIAWFADRGSAPVVGDVVVAERTVDRLIGDPVAARHHAPVVRIRTTRPTVAAGERLGVDVTLRNPGRPGQYDAYLILRGPEGARFFDGHDGWWPAEQRWVPWNSHLPLPALVTARFALPVRGLGLGPHDWHVVLTEPGTARVVARATAPFTVR